MSRIHDRQNGCPQAPQIDPFLDGRLDPENRRRMTDHLRRCEACREERAHLVALRRMSRALPRREIGASAVQRAKSALQERNRRGRRRRDAAELFADLFADRPLALHGAAIALGLLVSIACYGLGRFHEARFEPGPGIAEEVAATTPDRDAARTGAGLATPRFEPRIEAFIDPLEGSRGELVIERLEAPAPEDEVPEKVAAHEPVETSPKVEPRETAGPPTGSGAGSPGILLRPEPAPLVAARPVEFSAEALEVLEEAGSVSAVTRQIGEAAPNWAKILSESLLGPDGLTGLAETRPREAASKRRSSRNLIVLLDDGRSKLRLHITLRFGLDIEPEVEVRSAEARPLEKSATPKR